jgi:methyltransferase family protein
VNEIFKRLDEYRGAVLELFSELPPSLERQMAVRDSDALTLSYFLEHYPAKPHAVLEVGTFVGVSTFLFAAHDTVSRVVSVDPNFTLSEVVRRDFEGEWMGTVFNPSQEEGSAVGVQDVAKSALERFPNEGGKVSLVEGTTKDVNLEQLFEPGDHPIAFVDGAHTAEWAQADLQAVFSAWPRTVAIMHDCRGLLEPQVLAGVIGFIEDAEEGYRFRRLHSPEGPGTNHRLGLVYPEARSRDLESEGLLADPTTEWLEARVRVSKLRKRVDRLKDKRAAVEKS